MCFGFISDAFCSYKPSDIVTLHCHNTFIELIKHISKLCKLVQPCYIEEKLLVGSLYQLPPKSFLVSFESFVQASCLKLDYEKRKFGVLCPQHYKQR